MMQLRKISLLKPGTAALLMAILLGGDALTSHSWAGAASPWVKQHHASTRLVADTATWRENKQALVAGIHIKLDEGWKTYWRNPGDSGLPPAFDWSGSRNLKAARLLWPAPVRFHDSAGTSYGYKKEVVFPVVIEPEKAGEPVDLRLKLEFAVCADICIPAEAELKLEAGNDGIFSSSYTALLTKFLDRVPVTQPAASKGGPSISRTQAQLNGPAPYLTVDARFPNGGEDADLFIEGPQGFYLPPANRVGEQDDGTLRFKVDLSKGDDPKALKGKTVTMTLVSTRSQAETTWHIE